MEARPSTQNADLRSLNFKAFLEDAEEDELEKQIIRKQSQNDGYHPDYLWTPPDTKTFGHTFIYQPDTGKLFLDKMSKRHADMGVRGGINGRIRFPSEDSGDNFKWYKTKYPLIIVWNNNEDFIKDAMKAIVEKFHDVPHIEESMLVVGGQYKGRINTYIGTKTVQKEEEKIWIAGGYYFPSQLPAMLHTLPQNSDQYKQVASHICHSDLPLFQPFKTRACGNATFAPKRIDLQTRLAMRAGD